MKKILLGVFALATAFAMTMAAPAPAKAGNFWSGFAGGAAGAVIGNAISQPRYRYGYQPPPPVVYQAPPAYVAPAPSLFEQLRTAQYRWRMVQRAGLLEGLRWLVRVVQPV